MTDASGNFIASASAQLLVAKIQDSIVGSDEVALATGGADAGNNFRFDSTNNQYIFNFDTNSLSTGTWQLRVELDDGKSYNVSLSVKG